MNEVPYPGDIPYIDKDMSEHDRKEKIEFVFDIKRNAMSSEAVRRFYELQNLTLSDVIDTRYDTICMRYTIHIEYVKIVVDTLMCINEIINDPDVEVKDGWHIEHEHYRCLLYEMMIQFDKFRDHQDPPPIGRLRRTLNFLGFGRKKVKAR
jgi:hypothetical protein